MSRLNNAEVEERRKNATPRGASVLCNFFADRAENAELWDVEGKRFIDFGGGIAVCNTGHRHPKIVRSVSEQLGRFTHTAYSVTPYESYVDLAERINELAPGSSTKKSVFFTTGVEAVENAVKIARAATKRSGVVAFTGGFHGRTVMGMALTGKLAPYKLGFGPFPPEVFHVPFPSARDGVTVDAALSSLNMLFKTDIEPSRVAAIIFEPIQGEGGFRPAPAEFVSGLREICDANEILLIADEVQSGFARTGRMFAMHHYDVEADLICMAKSLAGGMPLSGVVGRAEIMDAPAPGGLGGTYAGNPMAIASALAVLDIIETEMLCDRAEVLGRQLTEFLERMRTRVPQIVDVRGRGAMIAVEFGDPDTADAAPDFVKSVQQRALDNGLLLLTCGDKGNVIRFLFPLTISDATFQEGLAILERALQSDRSHVSHAESSHTIAVE